MKSQFVNLIRSWTGLIMELEGPLKSIKLSNSKENILMIRLYFTVAIRVFGICLSNEFIW